MWSGINETHVLNNYPGTSNRRASASANSITTGCLVFGANSDKKWWELRTKSNALLCSTRLITDANESKNSLCDGPWVRAGTMINLDLCSIGVNES
jgi:hypothetical protein